MDRKQRIAVGIALQTQVLKTCPVHQQLYLDDDVDPASAFALAIELVRQRTPYVQVFQNDTHELTDLVSDTLAMAPVCCAECEPTLSLAGLGNRDSFAQGAFQGR
jgi:hypothetical protein